MINLMNINQPNQFSSIPSKFPFVRGRVAGSQAGVWPVIARPDSPGLKAPACQVGLPY